MSGMTVRACYLFGVFLLIGSCVCLTTDNLNTSLSTTENSFSPTLNDSTTTGETITAAISTVVPTQPSSLQVQLNTITSDTADLEVKFIDENEISKLRIIEELEVLNVTCTFNKSMCDCSERFECETKGEAPLLLTLRDLIPGTIYQFFVQQNDQNDTTTTNITRPVVPDFNFTVNEKDQQLEIFLKDTYNRNVDMSMKCQQEILGNMFLGEIIDNNGYCRNVSFGIAYKIIVSAERTYNNETKSNSSSKGGVKTRPYPVNNFKAVPGIQLLNFTWKNSDKNVQTLNYSLKIDSEEIMIPDDNFYVYNNAIPCKTYNGSLSAIAMYESDRSKPTEFLAEPLLPKDVPDIDIAIIPSTTYLNVSYNWTNEWENCITGRKVRYSYSKCLNGQEEAYKDIIGNSPFQISNLTEYRAIEVQIIFDLKINRNTSGRAISETKPAASGVPENFTALSSTNTSFTLKWANPNPCNIKGKITGYKVCTKNIKNLWTEEVESSENCKNVSTLSYTNDDAKPYHSYNMSVRVLQEEGTEGLESLTSLQTEEGVPSEVQISMESVSYNSIKINWTEPAQPNGDLLYSVQYKGLSCNDDANGTSITRERKYLFRNLSPYRKYSITVIPKTGKFDGASTNVISLTKKGVSEPVRYLNASTDPPSESENKTIIVEWLNPECPSASSDDITYIVTVDDQQPIIVNHPNNSTTIHSLKPYTSYKVRVIVHVKDVGDSPIKEESIKTRSAKPKNLKSVVLEPFRSENCTDVKLTARWNELKDEDIHGEFKMIKVILSDSDSQIEEKIFTDQKQTSYNFQQKLTGDQQYTLKYSVHNNEFMNENSKERRTHSCYPPNATVGQIFTPEQHPTKDSIELSLLRDFFENSKNGKIVERGLLVCDYAYNTNNITQSNLNTATFRQSVTTYYRANQKSVIPLYQTTGTDFDELFNTFARNPQTEVKYTIGKKECKTDSNEPCNGKLKSKRKYKILAFIATNAGFYVSPHISVETASSINAGAIAAGVVVPIILIAILIVGFLVWRRRQYPTAKRSSDSNMGGHINPVLIDPAVIGEIPQEKFHAHCLTQHKDSNMAFSEEYHIIKERSERPANNTTNSSELPENRGKNRYTNISPYDQSRVKLTPAQDDDSSDYINANYIPGIMGPREYIAAQGPLPSTITDFWRMIWQQEIQIVVMLTDLRERGRIKCEPYWPTLEEELFYGDVRVRNISESTCDNYVQRVLSTSVGETTRHIHHFKFSKWPDFGCLDDPQQLINFIREVRSHTSSVPQNKPKLIHCSAGVGRTGTYIAVDRLLHKVESDQSIDVFGTVLEMRKFRCHMVQTEDQYIFVHDCLDKAIQERFNPQPIYGNIENPIHLNSNSQGEVIRLKNMDTS